MISIKLLMILFPSSQMEEHQRDERYMKLLSNEKNVASGSGKKNKNPMLIPNILIFENDWKKSSDIITRIRWRQTGGFANRRVVIELTTKKKPSAHGISEAKFENVLLMKLDTPEEQNEHISFKKGLNLPSNINYRRSTGMTT